MTLTCRAVVRLKKCLSPKWSYIGYPNPNKKKSCQKKNFRWIMMYLAEIHPFFYAQQKWGDLYTSIQLPMGLQQGRGCWHEPVPRSGWNHHGWEMGIHPLRIHHHHLVGFFGVFCYLFSKRIFSSLWMVFTRKDGKCSMANCFFVTGG